MEKNTASSFTGRGKTQVAEQVEIAAVLDLAPFERFVFVISVLEHYSEHECSVLLGCSRRDVIAAQNRALQQIRGAMEFQIKQQVNVGSWKPLDGYVNAEIRP
jgi:DNA-directed RNA polymerase specialized sigma24 family protein